MRHSIHQLRPGVEFHLFTEPDLTVEPRGELVASDGKKVSRKDKLLALEKFHRCRSVREILLQRF
jgi:hypothetical protein